jgi:hypothetical protein
LRPSPSFADARRLLAFALLFPLAACNGASLATRWKLRDFNLGAADLSQLRLALRGPDWTTPTPQNAVLEVKTWTGDDESQSKILPLRLQAGAHPADAEELARQGGAPGLVVVELAPQSLAPARKVQEEAARVREQGGRTHVKLNLAGAIACRSRDIPPGAIAVDIFIHASDALGWLPLYAQFDARGEEKDDAKVAEALPPCAGKPKAR